MPEVYMISDTAFQVDCPDGASYVFAPSRLSPGHAEVLEAYQPRGSVRAHAALLSAIVSVI